MRATCTACNQVVTVTVDAKDRKRKYARHHYSFPWPDSPSGATGSMECLTGGQEVPAGVYVKV